MATQLQQYLVYVSPFVALWILLFVGLIEMAHSHICLYYLPCLILFAFGLYAIYSVISGALSIHNCTYAQVQLQKEIDEAHKELKKRGVILEE